MIRDITCEDIELISKIGYLYDNNFDNHYNLNSYIDNSIYLLKCYEEDNIIKGFVIATKLYENIEILLIYVLEQYRKQGIGTKLIKNLESYDDIQNIILEVSKENTKAISLYSKLDFKKIDTRKKYYDGIDALVLKKVVK